MTILPSTTISRPSSAVSGRCDPSGVRITTSLPDNVPILRTDHLATLELSQAQPSLVRLLLIVPVGWHPLGRRVPALHDQAAPRRLESQDLLVATHGEGFSTSGRDRRLEQDLVPLLIPQPTVGDGNDEVWPRLLGGVGRREQVSQAIYAGTGLELGPLQCFEVVVEHHAGHVAGEPDSDRVVGQPCRVRDRQPQHQQHRERRTGDEYGRATEGRGERRHG
jgi:hypothetical protein